MFILHAPKLQPWGYPNYSGLALVRYQNGPEVQVHLTFGQVETTTEVNQLCTASCLKPSRAHDLHTLRCEDNLTGLATVQL